MAELLHNKMPELIDGILGGCEETTTGINRLNSMKREGVLRYPVIKVNDARCKYLFDNRYGTDNWFGTDKPDDQSGCCGENVVVAGYGWCEKALP